MTTGSHLITVKKLIAPPPPPRKKIKPNLANKAHHNYVCASKRLGSLHNNPIGIKITKEEDNLEWCIYRGRNIKGMRTSPERKNFHTDDKFKKAKYIEI
jgi:hypothetical protein